MGKSEERASNECCYRTKEETNDVTCRPKEDRSGPTGEMGEGESLPQERLTSQVRYFAKEFRLYLSSFRLLVSGADAKR